MGYSIFGICVIFHNKKGLKTLINLIETNYTYKAFVGAQEACRQPHSAKAPVLSFPVPGEKQTVSRMSMERPTLQECGGQYGPGLRLVRMREGLEAWSQLGGCVLESTTALHPQRSSHWGSVIRVSSKYVLSSCKTGGPRWGHHFWILFT